MTFVHNLLADFEDILSVRLTCGKCGVATSYPKTSWKQATFSCLNCQHLWFAPGSADRQAMIDLMEGLMVLSKRSKDAPASLQFELKSPS